ncbi:aminopeptidase [Clostridium sp.]|uniref:aminopeptidase n=1 Tax=Clostridium sp. TaxID=1506 RepID=UPI003464E56E
MLSTNLIQKIVTAMGIKKGDMVLLQFWGENKDRDTLNAFSYEVAKVDATPIEFQHSREYYKNLFESFTDDYSIPEEYFNIFKDSNVIIDLFTYKPVIPHKDFPSEKLYLYKEFMAKLFSILSSKEKFIQLRLPTLENSMESNLDYETFKNSLFNAYDIDYEALNNDCDEIIKSLSDKNSIVIETNKNHRLSLDISKRSWFKDCGDGDMPCGEVFIAPIEESSNGSIYIEKFYFEDKTINDLTLNFENGVLTSTSSDTLNSFLETLPPKGNILCEFGIGLNKNVKDIVGYTILDEKAYGTYHIAIGMNSMFGGKNESPFHMDFVFKGNVTYI